MENIKLTNDILENQIKTQVIPSLFYNLNYQQKELLCNLTIKIINIIAICFSFDIQKYKEKYIYQFEQNNYQDVKWIMLHLLPYINIENDSNKITSFQDIYTKKREICDINECEPVYLYSNIQYNKCIREKDNYKERDFTKEDIIQNYYILVDTIRQCSNKLCVNWANIMPYNLITYKKSKLYEDTIKSFFNKKIYDWNPNIETNFELSNETLCVKLMEKSKGLYVGHLYEEIADLFYCIKDYKWIIFDLIIDDSLASMTEFLAVYFKDFSKLFLEFSEWESLNQSQKDAFYKYIEDLKSSITTRKLTNFKITTETIKYFIRGLTYSFDKSNYKNKAKQEGYTSISDELKKDSDEELFDEDDENNSTDFSLIFRCFCSIKLKFIYEYIAESTQKLKQTWYGYYLLTKDKSNFEIFYDKKFKEIDKISISTEYINNNEILVDCDDCDENSENSENSEKNEIIKLLKPTNKTAKLFIEYDKEFRKLSNNLFAIKLQPKNVYNFAKSFCHTIRNFKPLPKHWMSLTQEEKEEVKKKLNTNYHPLNWFNIPNYIRRSKFIKLFEQQELTQNLLNIAEQIDEINKSKDKNNDKMQIATSNILIYIMMKKLIIDIIFRSLIHKGILTKFIPNNATTEKRLLDGNLENVLKFPKSKKILDKTFEESELNPYWTNTYHYMTALPYKFMNTKKFEIIAEDKKGYNFFSYCKINSWYMAGAYDWIGQIGFCHHFINNRIIFITGGTGVGKSTEIPKLFVYYSRVLDGILAPKVVCTQPRQQPVIDNASYVSLTSGIPIFQGDKKTTNFNIQFKYKGNKHQEKIHSPSLLYITGDSLLIEIKDPLLKKSYTNKQTGNLEYTQENMYDIIMIDEAHEHKKHMDLLITILKLPISVNNSLRLVIVSATMDDDEARYRRFFRDINDNKKYPLCNWIAESKIDRINVDRRYHIAAPGAGTRYEIKEFYRPISDKGDELYVGIKDVVKEILAKSTSGDILIFQPGISEITKTIEILVNNTPQNVFIFPFNRELDDLHKEPTTNINVRKNIKIDKRQNFADTPSLTKGNNNYDRFIIVATNIAEASVTIPELKYVIETGTEKANKYDYKKRSEVLFKDIISESSRRQRKGRVGRRYPGEVYYMYKQGLTENNKIPYEFSRMKVDDIIFQYLREDIKEEINELLKYDLCNNKIKLILDEIKSKSLKKIIENQYYIGSGINKKFYAYYGDDNMYDYNNYKSPCVYYKSGTDGQTLNDSTGEYFIIHPDELELVRNINGDIVNIKNKEELEFIKTSKYKGFIISKKMESFWKLLIDKLYISAIKISKHNYDYIKTDIGIFFVKNPELFGITNENLIRTIVYGLCLNYEDIIKFCALCQTISFDITSLFKTFMKEGKKQSLIPSAYELFGTNIESDGFVIIKILNEIHEILTKYNYDGNLFEKNYITQSDLTEKKLNFETIEIIEIINKPNNISEKIKEKLNEDKIDDIIDKTINIIKKNIFIQIQQNKNCITEIKNYCDIKYLDLNKIAKYLTLYYDVKCELLKLKYNDKLKFIFNLKEKFEYIDACYKKNSLKTALLFGFSQNIVINICNTEKYLSLYSPNHENIYSISSFSQNLLKTFVSKENTKEYLLYLLGNTEREEINMLFKINIQDIILLPHIYHIKHTEPFDKTTYITNKIKKYEELKNNPNININKAKTSTIGYVSNDVMIYYIQTLQKFIIDLNGQNMQVNKNLDFIKILEPKLKKHIDFFISQK